MLWHGVLMVKEGPKKVIGFDWEWYTEASVISAHSGKTGR